MKNLLFMLMLLMVSCTNTVQILESSEKVDLYVKPYVKGDTVMLRSMNNGWAVDINWEYLVDTTIVGPLGNPVEYRRAVIID